MMIAQVYRNLSPQYKAWGSVMYSVRDKSTRRVDGRHYPSVVLVDVKLRVSQAGRERVRTTGVKNVHAFAEGRLLENTLDIPNPAFWGMRRATYNPYRNETFVDRETGEVITESKVVVLNSSGMWYLPKGLSNRGVI